MYCIRTKYNKLEASVTYEMKYLFILNKFIYLEITK